MSKDDSSALEVEFESDAYLIRHAGEVKGQLEWEDGAWVFTPSWADEQRWDDLKKADKDKALERAKGLVAKDVAG